MTGKTALITGAGRANSIAHATALALADDGWDIAFTTWTAYEARVPLGSDPERGATELDAELRRRGAGSLRIEADLADPATPDRVLAEAEAELGPVSALVLSHAESVDSSIADTTVESFDRHFAVNVRAAWLLIRAFAAQAPADGGRIVALTSDHVVHNLPYGASKGALDRIVEAASGELAERGITANLINPGPIDTGWMDASTREFLTARQPTGRLGTPEDTARLIRFLASEDAAWVTGQLIHSEGGFRR
ncbi:SDR family oxidoreductase [Microbacterium sp. ASV49]|uniref:SDR family oxidoreductase n=1 Tax=Microbacterium candidum TaxID=3041922 RepID=A0ABT7N4I4_9MICO|nr:SDR family oxidoreductase [Microbacterium sp. ASV49]MDL9981620.1 SDR family oxidoreductase [Microbacterium sp. ASV49]